MPENGMIAECLRHFDFPASTFANYKFVERGKKSIYIVSRNVEPSGDFFYQGIPFMRIQTLYPKITGVAAMKFGPHARKNRVTISADQSRNFLRRQPIIVTEDQKYSCDGNAYVLVFHLDRCLGVGYLADDNQLASLVPKSWSEFQAAADELYLKSHGR